MNILITGGAGFQGSHLAEHFLKEGHKVTILNTYSEAAEANINDFAPKVKVIWGSITDREIVEKSVRGQNTVFHLAARINVDESISHPEDYIDVNVKGTFQVLEAVKRHGCRLIYASTCEVYGAPIGRDLIDETTELRPHSPYAASKVAADRLCFAYYKTYKVPVTIVRPFNIYGERQKEGDGGALIAIFVKKALDKLPLKVFGSGSQTRDYMHVSDLIQAYDTVLKRDETIGETINFGTGKETAIKDIAEFIAKKLGVDIEYLAARLGEVDRFKADTHRAQKYDFSPRVDIWEGIERYINWRKTVD